jgi:hypothetical protein
LGGNEMARKKKLDVEEAPRPNASWEYLTETQINGRYVNKGTELKIKGERGRFRFVHLVKNGDKEWVDVWGGPKNCESLRSFRLERIQRVHYKNQTDKNLAREYKDKKKTLKENPPEE